MGNNQSTSRQRPLRCILDNWKLFDSLTLRRNCLKFFCATAWPQYRLGDDEHWPEDGSLNYNTILQLQLFCKRQGKWTEIPYVQIFFRLRDIEEFIGPGLHLRPIHADHAQPPFQWTLNSVFSAYENNNRRIRSPPDRGTLKIISRLLIA